MSEPGFDREIDLRKIVLTGVGLGALLVVTAVLMWPLAATLRDAARELDPPPPALPEALRQEPPAGPRLQAAPEQELRVLRAQEDAVLDGWAWIGEEGRAARIPVERALELVVEHGLDAGRPAAGGEAPVDASQEQGGTP